MLVLTRKVEEQILIGDDIKITLLKVRGNSVRIGIEAPREVRVIRGEIEQRQHHSIDMEMEDSSQAHHESVFAHEAAGPAPLGGQVKKVSTERKRPKHCPDRFDRTAITHRRAAPTRNRARQVFVGGVQSNGDGAYLVRTPLKETTSAH